MIQAVLLIALGFLTASLIGVFVAPALWHRASRLSRKRLEQTLPVTLSEIEAAQDQLRASYAVRMRRLETALANAKQKAAAQLVENSRLQMQIAALKDQIAGVDLKLSERRNAAAVLEQTITRRFPELDHEIAEVRAQLQTRSHDIQDLSNRLNRRSEELEEAQRDAASYQEEVERLRQAFEKNSGDRAGRRLRGASKWSLDDYRAEYDRLNLELSRLRQQIAQLQDRDAGQSGIIKGELHKLTELILASAEPRAVAASESLPPAKRGRGAETRRGRPVPWSEAGPKPAVAATNSPVASYFGAPPVKSAKPEPSNGSSDPGDGSRAGRSKLLLEAVSEKVERQNGDASVKKDAGSLDAPAGPGAEGASAAIAAANGADSRPDSASSHESASPKDEHGRLGGALLENLREADGEAV